MSHFSSTRAEILSQPLLWKKKTKKDLFAFFLSFYSINLHWIIFLSMFLSFFHSLSPSKGLLLHHFHSSFIFKLLLFISLSCRKLESHSSSRPRWNKATVFAFLQHQKWEAGSIKNFDRKDQQKQRFFKIPCHSCSSIKRPNQEIALWGGGNKYVMFLAVLACH